ncbi:MAG: rhodanese-like domain-containing protein [Leptolyngbya sp. Prado105]|jgi:rhodanese-related sulfurtransferase|nr:rhodanese-like domain-containing protein [Leptolyngbya sp. Prado105]
MQSRPKPASSRVQSSPILLSSDEASSLLDKLIVLDVQNPKYATKMLPKAQRLNLDIELKDIAKTQSILVTCLSGQRSFRVAQQLIQRGYHSIYVLKGGVIAWRRAGHITQLIRFPA